MQDKIEKIQRFLAACDEIVNGKFISADTKIPEILKAIASSKELTDLFTAVTERFDYPAAKRAYLKFPAAPGSAHGTAFLPAERGDVLAFVFCLLVDFDAGTIRFNDFLLRYFYEDGSYTASFSHFAHRLIRPFRDIVKECFPEASSGAYEQLSEFQNHALGMITEKISVERARISVLLSREEDRAAGEQILSELAASAGRKDFTELKALATGYCYFLRATGAEEGNGREISVLAETL